jgi:hypothetical protein
MGRRKDAFLRKSITDTGFMFLMATIAIACLTILLFAIDSHQGSQKSDAEEMRLFQHGIGGLGMGAGAAPTWSVLHFDPRLQSVDDSNLWPVPGSYPFSPSAASSAVVFKELPREDLTIRIEP